MLNKRQQKIIMLMNEDKEWIMGKELAKLFSVSDRTIRNDIANINNFYEDILIMSNIRRGYKIDEYKIHSLNIEISEIIPQTSKERCAYIIQELLFGKGKINLIQLQEKIFISESSLDNDIKKIRQILDKYPSLKIIRKSNYIELIGSEDDKRSLYKSLLTNETKGNFLNLNKIASLFKDFDLIRVKSILEETLREYRYHVREAAIPRLMLHIGVTIDRMLKYKFIKTDRGTNELKNSIEYKISKKVFYKISCEINIKVIEDEVVLFALLLLGKKGTSYSNEIVEKKIECSTKNLVLNIIDDIENTFGINFRDDNEFKVGFEMHIISLLERYVHNIDVDNMYLNDIKRKYPFIFEMGVRVCKILEEQMHIKIKENEILFIALHLGAAYERANLKRKHRVLMIYPYNQMLSGLFLNKIISKFSDRIEIIKCMNFFEESEIEDLKPELILTTLPLEHNLNILTIEISIFMNYKDESNIFQALNRLDEIRYKEDFEFLILKLIKKEFFYTRVRAENPKEIISKMCDNLYHKGYVTDKFKESVLQRENISATSFMYGFSVPHSINGGATKRSTISIAILDNPIKWGEFEVRFVILLAITEEDRNLLRIFFDWLSSTISNPSKFASILKIKDYNEFIENIIK